MSALIARLNPRINCTSVMKNLEFTWKDPTVALFHCDCLVLDSPIEQLEFPVIRKNEIIAEHFLGPNFLSLSLHLLHCVIDDKLNMNSDDS